MSLPDKDICLVRMNDSHLTNTFRWLSESGALRQEVDCLEPPTPAGNECYWHKNWDDKTREDYAIVDTAGRHVGNCGLCDIDLRRRKAQLWIYLGDCQGAGLGTAAITRLLARAFRGLHLNRVYLRVLATNQRALGFYVRLGFVQEGVFRQDTLAEGNYVDATCMSMLASDYLATHLPEPQLS